MLYLPGGQDNQRLVTFGGKHQLIYEAYYDPAMAESHLKGNHFRIWGDGIDRIADEKTLKVVPQEIQRGTKRTGLPSLVQVWIDAS